MNKPSIELLRSRADLLRELRAFFDSRGFLEVQPPCLSHDCIVDPYIDPIEVSAGQFKIAQDLPARFFLQTSPEAAMKRLLAAGAPSIYSLGPVFRAGERGKLHNIEFTMLEWYELDAGVEAGIQLLGELACEILGNQSFDVLTYRQLFRDSLQFDPLEANLETLQRHVAIVDESVLATDSDDRDLLLDVLLSQAIQSNLGCERPVILRDYPLSQAALACASKNDPECASRFELFVDGIEIANGYDELRDPEVLIKRTRVANQKRVATGRAAIDQESAFLEAMRTGLPPCAGVALGVDRLLMVRTGEKSIEKVMPFPTEIA